MVSQHNITSLTISRTLTLHHYAVTTTPYPSSAGSNWTRLGTERSKVGQSLVDVRVSVLVFLSPSWSSEDASSVVLEADFTGVCSIKHCILGIFISL